MTVSLELLIIAALIMANGLLSMAEFALVSSRRVRLSQMAERGDAGAQCAIEITQDPGTFLSTIQIGITLIGILAGAYGGATLTREFQAILSAVPWIKDYSDTICLFIVVLIITYFTLVFGELVPKRIGLAHPEKIASLVALPIKAASRLISPLNILTNRSTDAVLWLFGSQSISQPAVTEEDITILLEEGTEAGVFKEAEQDLVRSVFRFGDREVISLMAPRPDVVFLDLTDNPEVNREKISSTGHTRYPVCNGGVDSIVGVLSIRDLWAQIDSGSDMDLEPLVQDVLVIPEHITALELLEMFKTARTPLAVIIDEYGSVSGIITLHDLLEAIVGDLSMVDEADEEPAVIERDDGSWLIDGMLPITDLKVILEQDLLPGEREGHFRTIAGYVMAELGKIPSSGEWFIRDGYRFEVVDMDQRRIDKILIQRTEVKSGESQPPSESE
ncbi:MAG TPA: hemolysin family protein [Methanospirillum sp.]|nr:hemolysin family protein [Methanospirillum sp.]